MADEPISTMPNATFPLSGDELWPIIQAGANAKIAVSDFFTQLCGGFSVNPANEANGPDSNGGDMYVSAGAGGTNGGHLYLQGGFAGAGNHNGGSIDLTPGNGNGTGLGGNTNIVSGEGDSADAGSINLTGGHSFNAKGGDISLTPGTGVTAGLIILHNLPIADPHVLNALWNNAGALNISAG